jgi:PEP-CTERM motif
MYSSFRSCFAATALIVLALIATHPAKADTYKITVVDHTQSENFLGIDDKGDFVINDNGNNAIKCGEPAGNPCFEVFLVGQSPFFTTTAPVLAFDNGASCAVVLDASFAPQSTALGICNNGHEIFGAFTGIIQGVFDGPDVSDVILHGTFDGGHINANGDAVFIDGFADELIFAQDLTTASTPEPSSLLLLGTGCLSILGTLRRYRRSRVW